MRKDSNCQVAIQFYICMTLNYTAQHMKRKKKLLLSVTDRRGNNYKIKQDIDLHN